SLRFDAWRKCGLELGEGSIQTETKPEPISICYFKQKANKIGFWRLNMHKSSTLQLTPHFAKPLLADVHYNNILLTKFLAFNNSGSFFKSFSKTEFSHFGP